MAVLELSNIYFKYGKEPILNDLSFSLEKGDFAAIIGSNGSGKSTLLKVILGFLEADQGYVFFENDSDTLGYIPQGGLESKDFIVTVEELLRFRKPNASKQEIYAALDKVKLSHESKTLIKKLSGGQKQRVLIARELLNDPDIIILDEPTTGLDSDSIQKLYELLSKLNKEENRTIVLVTHHLDELFESVNRSFLLQDHTIKELNHV